MKRERAHTQWDLYEGLYDSGSYLEGQELDEMIQEDFTIDAAELDPSDLADGLEGLQDLHDFGRDF